MLGQVPGDGHIACCLHPYIVQHSILAGFCVLMAQIFNVYFKSLQNDYAQAGNDLNGHPEGRGEEELVVHKPINALKTTVQITLHLSTQAINGAWNFTFCPLRP